MQGVMPSNVINESHQLDDDGYKKTYSFQSDSVQVAKDKFT